jgi:hypothetical protein
MREKSVPVIIPRIVMAMTISIRVKAARLRLLLGGLVNINVHGFFTQFIADGVGGDDP